QAILTGCFNTDYLYQQPAPRQKALAASISHLLGIEKLLARNVQQLSTGELRKILIARALVGAPAVLILDEVCDGLDARSRDQLLQVVGRIARTGTQVLYATHRAEEMIPAITHQLVLEKGFIVSCRKRSDAAQVFAANGAGKSTLVKLVFGDLHPAIGGSVRRFDLTPKDSIWALKKQIGYVSPEFQANYAERVTAAEVVASGFFSSVGLRDRVSR